MKLTFHSKSWIWGTHLACGFVDGWVMVRVCWVMVRVGWVMVEVQARMGGCIVVLAIFLLQSPEIEGGSMWLI